MPRQDRTIQPIVSIPSELTGKVFIDILNSKIEEINNSFTSLDLMESQLRGEEGNSISYGSTIDLQGNRITGAGLSQRESDYVTRSELRKNSVFVDNRTRMLTALRMLSAEGGIVTSPALTPEGAVTLAQLLSTFNGADADAAPPRVTDTSDIGVNNKHFAREQHTHQGVNLDAVQIISALKTFLTNIIITNTSPGLDFVDTTASAKSLRIVTDVNLAELRELAGASGSLLVLDLTNNRVGIGRNNPAVLLDVYTATATGTIRLTSTPTTALAQLTLEGESSTHFVALRQNNSATANTFLVNIPLTGLLFAGSSDTGGLVIMTAAAAAPIIFGTGGTALTNERMRIDGTGLVGINTTTLTERLNIVGAILFKDSSSSSGFTIKDRPAVPGHQVNFIGNASVSSAGTVMNIFSAASSPSSRSVSNVSLFSVNLDTSSELVQAAVGIDDNATANMTFRTTFFGTASVMAAGGFVWLPNNVEKMRLLASGNLGIGTAVPTSPLHVVGLPVYANNAAAVAGGLTVGAFYRTGADPDPVCVVH